MESTIPNPPWPFLGRWVVGSVVGWIGGTLGAIVLSYLVVNLFYPEETNLIAGLCIGAAVALLQCKAVRPWAILGWAWVWGAMVIAGPPFIAFVVLKESGVDATGSMAVGAIGAVAVAGALVGSAIQARTLRSHTDHAYRWILISVVSWGAASGSESLIGFGVGGVVLGLLSGAMLLLLLREPRASAPS